MISNKLTVSVLAIVGLVSASAVAQSSDQNFPSPVTQSQIESTIKARDIGDARLTTHYWAFDGGQGDIFINVVTQNFSGDIDVYQASDLKPLTKMVMYADTGVSETGRVIYMRQPGRLLLRVQGRTPNDDPASYKIKFAGSFVALAPKKQEGPPTVGETEDTGIEVNSVGTIIAVKPKAVASPSPESAAAERNTSSSTSQSNVTKADENSERPPQATSKNESPDVQTVFGNKAAKVTVTKPPASAAATPPVKKAASPPAKRTENKPTDPLAGYRLVIVFKDGSRDEREMTKVVRFSYDRGTLIIVNKDGSVERFPATAVSSVAVQQP